MSKNKTSARANAKTSLSDALKGPVDFSFNKDKPASAPVKGELAVADDPKAYVAPSRQGKKALTTYVDPAALKQLKLMALDQECSLQDLLNQALNDLCIKHKKAPLI